MAYPVVDAGVPSLGDVASNPDVRAALAEVAEHAEAYERAREYDEVDLWVFYDASREGRTLRQADIEYDPNLCGVVIDAVNDLLTISSVTADHDAGTEVINRVWADNQLHNYVPHWNRKALRDGDAYLVVWPVYGPEPATEPPADPTDPKADGEPIPTSVNITYVDPRRGRMFYDAENPRLKRVFAQVWVENSPDGYGDGERSERTRLNLIYPDRIEKYVSRSGTKGESARDFEPYVESYELVADEDGEPTEIAVWPEPNPYGVIPVFHLRTDLEYGRPEHRNAFAPQDAVSKLIEMQMVTVQFQGWPQAYALQEVDSLKSQALREDPLADSSPQTDDDDLLDALGPDRLPSGDDWDNETGSKLSFGPGQIALLKGFKAVGQFTTADPGSFLDPLREYAKMISATTSTPLWKFQGLGGQVPSGESLRIIRAPLVSKVRSRARMFGGEYEDLFETALLMLGLDGMHVTVAWENPDTTDIKEAWELARAKIELGVPPHVAFMDMGVPEPQAKEWETRYEETWRRREALAGLLERSPAARARLARGAEDDRAED